MDKISIRNAKFAKVGLSDMCDDIGDMSQMEMVEIGSYVGDSAEIFAERVAKLFCVDPWENDYDEKDAASYQHPMYLIEAQFDKMAEQFINIAKMKMKSSEAVKKFEDESLDVVYIDGLHTYDGAKEDISIWLPKVKKGGWICGHDYGSKHFPGVKKAVDEFFTPDKTYRDSSWAVRKK